MVEGTSNCVEALRWVLRPAFAFALLRARTALATITWFSVHNDEARKRERSIERLGKRQATTPHSPVKRPRLLEAQQRKYESIPHNANGGATWPF